MKKTILSIAGLLWVATAGAQYTVSGGTGSPLLAEDNKPSRIQVYLLNGLAGAEITFRTENEEAHQWYKYNTRYSEAVLVSSQQSGNLSKISDIADGWAYFVESPSYPTPSFVWIMDYSRYRPTIHSLEIQEEDDKCEFLKLIARVDAEPLAYRTYSGATVDLPRTYHLQYHTLAWDDDARAFVPKEENLPVRGILSEIPIDAPLQNTSFTLSGDTYAEHFGTGQRIETAEYPAIALEVHARMTAVTSTGETESVEPGTQQSYSAPLEARFEGYANEPVAALYVWNILKTNPATGEQTSILRYTDRSVNYTFRESGHYIARLEVVDARSVCFDESQSFAIFIGESDLKLPNVFSPGSSPGVNDEYKVSYKSLIRFKASIYNRWGNLLYHWDDPAKGWDGKVDGRYVPTGVYFIVVEAQGADGRVYKQSKDINVLRAKQ
ncbi:MAG: gliding motility-associated C-terminal domain-containing protein [Dysgonamonadaceae bacterium]|jgi:gliding motility-associated-like protein|nr:gliding motility-associated C-terminal domain-containing protein [Dysgonamonadaceae bacterium]